MEASLRLHQHRPGTLTGLDEYLFGRTSGMIGSLSQLVRGAAVLAIQDGTEQITRKLLDLGPRRSRRATLRHPAARPPKPGQGVNSSRRLPIPLPRAARNPRLLAAPPRRSARPEPRRPAPPSAHRPGRRPRRRDSGPGMPAGGGDRVPGQAAGPGAARTASASTGLAVPAPPRAAGLPPLHCPVRSRAGTASVRPPRVPVHPARVLDRATRPQPRRPAHAAGRPAARAARRTARCCAAPNAGTAGPPHSTPLPPPPASASACGSGRCTTPCGCGGNSAWT